MIAQDKQPAAAMPATTPRHPLWLLSGFWICVLIALGVAFRRLFELTRPPSGGSSSLAVINATFSSHALLTVAHIIPASLFVIVAARVLLRPTSSPLWQRLFFISGAITGATAYAMTRYAIGGWVERSAVLVFDTWFLFSLGRAYSLRANPGRTHMRTWMTRSVGILLGIATTRPVMGVFFATSPLTHLAPAQFFGFAFWAGFSINALIIELWLRSEARARTRPSELPRIAA